MKKILYILISTLFVASGCAQTNNVNTPYYRNALTSMMIYHPEDEFGYDVYKIFTHLPAFEKFDNHDVDRIHKKLSDNRHFVQVHILLYTLPGIPSL